MVELLFVNVDHPSQLSNPRARRSVRSHISRRQHAQNRAQWEEQGLERTRLRLTRPEDAVTSQFDTAMSSPSIDGSMFASPCDSDHGLASPAQLEMHFTQDEGAMEVPQRNSHRERTDLGRDHRVQRHAALTHTDERQEQPEDDEQHSTYVPHPHHTNRRLVAMSKKRGPKRERPASPAIKIEEDAVNHALQLTSTTLAVPTSQHTAAPPQAATVAPKVQFSPSDPDELQGLAVRTGVSVSALIDHFLRTADVMGAHVKRDLELPPSYMRRLWTNAICGDPVVRLTMVHSMAASLRFLYGTVFPPTFLRGSRAYMLASFCSAMADPVRRVSDDMLVAVTLTALAELLYGSAAHHALHVRGIAGIREARGTTLDPHFARVLTYVGTLELSRVAAWTTTACDAQTNYQSSQ